MSYQRSRAIPSFNAQTAALLAAPTAEGSVRRGRSKNGGSVRSSRSRSYEDHPKRVGRSLHRRQSSSYVEEGCRSRSRSTSISARRGRRGSTTMTRSSSPSCRRRSVHRRNSTTGVTTTYSNSERHLPPLQKSKTDTGIKGVLKTSTNSDSPVNKRQSKASAGILAIASSVDQDEMGSPKLLRTIRASPMPRKQVSFDFNESEHTSSTCSSSRCSSKSPVHESLRKMKHLQNKFRRYSQQGFSISEAEQARLAKEVPMLNGATPEFPVLPLQKTKHSCIAMASKSPAVMSA